MSRKGELWRGDLAMHLEDHLSGELSTDDLIDWAMDHPFFEDREQLSDAEQRVIAHALGRILQMTDDEPPATRTTPDELADTVEILWQRKPLPPLG